MIYYLCFVLFLIGLYGVTCKKNIVKIILGLCIMEYSVNLFLILLGYRKNGIPPIINKGMEINEFYNKAVDPLPQALVLTSIVIGLGILSLMVAIAIRLYQRYGTFDITEMKKLKG
ncbi:MAG: sodium:proton antiporter [Candidatus Omnitrophica bacterium]|nr:sodium:proton antiporter [Candidatus Omnitrophota bacterium]MCM8802361.1 sodium:proton antiporter [Candidatus Omnitrophota bacterium]